MRIAFLAAVMLAACSPCLHAAANREATYVVGNLDGLEPGAAGIVLVDSDGLKFRSGKITIDAPFTKIASTELGAKLTHSEDVPLYKIWELHKRFAEKTAYQNFIVNFKDAHGMEQTMTLEMTASAAADVREMLERRTGEKAKRQQEDWWGDDIWRTNRNHQTWDQTAVLGSR